MKRLKFHIFYLMYNCRLWQCLTWTFKIKVNICPWALVNSETSGCALAPSTYYAMTMDAKIEIHLFDFICRCEIYTRFSVLAADSVHLIPTRGESFTKLMTLSDMPLNPEVKQIFVGSVTKIGAKSKSGEPSSNSELVYCILFRIWRRREPVSSHLPSYI